MFKTIGNDSGSLRVVNRIDEVVETINEAEALIANPQANVNILRTKFFDQWITQAQQK